MLSSRNELKNKSSQTVGASATNTVVSEVFRIITPLNICIDINTSDVGITNGITAKLQDSSGNDEWEDNGTVTITATAEVQTLTCDTKANTVDGDYFVLTDTNGLQWAIAFDTTGGSANTPTGAIWTAIPAGRKAEADISADTTAAQVAARVETAIDGLTGFTAVVTSDDTAADGTMTFTAVTAGPDMTAGQVLAKDDTAATTPALALATTISPVGTSNQLFTIALNITDDATNLPLRPLGRVVVTTGAGDTVDVDGIRVCQDY